MASSIGMTYRQEAVDQRLTAALAGLGRATGTTPVPPTPHRDPDWRRLNELDALAATVERVTAALGDDHPEVIEGVEVEHPGLDEIAAAAFIAYADDKRTGTKHDEQAFVEAVLAAYPVLPDVDAPVLGPPVPEPVSEDAE